YSSSSPGATCTLFLASLTACAQVSRDITAPPKAVAATAAPVTALAPRKPRRLRPPFTSFSFCLSLMGFRSYGYNTSPYPEPCGCKPQGSVTCTAGISWASGAAFLPRFLRLLISGGHLLSLW